MRKLAFIYLVSLLATKNLSGQDIHFSQYFVAPQLINPSGFGVLNSFEAGLQYKGQWNSFTNGYTSFAVFANKSFKKQKDVNSSKAYCSAGLNFSVDRAGDNRLSHFKAEVPVNVTKRVSSKSFLTAGLYVGFGQLSVRNDNLTWGSQFDGYQYNSSLGNNETSVLQSKNYLDCGAGLSFVTLQKDKELSALKNNVGFSISHLNRPDYSLYGMPKQRLNMRINFYEYYHFYFKNSSLSLIPSLLVQYQASAYEVIVGANVRKVFKESVDSRQSLSVGLFYRLKDMCAVNCMVDLNKYSIGLNYDFNISKLIASSRSFGGLEISVKMKTPFKYASGGSKTMGNQF